MIIEKVFDGHFYELLCDQYPQSVTLENYDSPSIFVEFTTKFLTHFQSVKSLEDASASTKIEVEHTFLTKTKFKFYGCDNVKYFLGRLTTYQRSLLRSVDICEEDSSTLKDKTWMDVYAQLPSGLTSVNFELCLLLGNGLLIYRGGGYRPNSKVSGFLDLLGKRIKRCWAPRANTNIQCIYSDYSRWNNVAHVAFAYEVEEWSRDWLQWWEKSQDGDQVEEQSSITDHSGFS